MRGTGSLRALLGKDSFAKGRPRSNQASSRDGSPADSASLASAAVAGTSSARLLEARRQAAASSPPLPPAGAGRPGSPLKADHVRCPVCSAHLPHDDNKINAHIDKCLSKGTLRKQVKQASIFKFAVPKQQQQQQASPAGRSPTRRRRDPAAAAALAAGAAAAAGEFIDVTGDGDVVLVDAEQPAGYRGDAGTAAAAAGAARRPCSRQQQPPAVQSPSVSWPSQSTPGSQQARDPVQQTPSSENQQQQQQQQHAQQQPSSVPPPQRTPSVQQHLPSPAVKRRPAAAPGALRCFPCAVVGRQFQKNEAPCQSGQRLVVEHEPGNPRDAHALLALDAESRCPLGHLPHVVARHLAPLLRSQQVVAEAVVQEEPLTDKAPLLVELQIALRPPAPGASPGAAGRLAAALGRAEAAAASQLQQPPQASGERLHSNFLTVLQIVQQHDAHLLADLETGFVATYKALPLHCQCLFLRLFQRRGPLFNISTLSYKEVPDAAAAAAELATAGLAAVMTPAVGTMGGPSCRGAMTASGTGTAKIVQAAGSSGSLEADVGASSEACDWRQLAGLLTVPELAVLMSAHRIQASGPAAGNGGNLKNRAQLLAAFEAHAAISHAAAAMLAGWLLEASGPVVRLAAASCEAVTRLQRLFFLNEGQSLSQFLVSDLGALQYPQYQVHRSCSAFRSRRELLEYEEALGHAGALSEALEEGDTERAEAALVHAWAALDDGAHKQERGGISNFLQRFNAGWVYCMMAIAGVSLLEQQRAYKEAVERLEQLLGGRCCPTRRGDWWVRLTTDLEHLKRCAL